MCVCVLVMGGSRTSRRLRFHHRPLAQPLARRLLRAARRGPCATPSQTAETVRSAPPHHTFPGLEGSHQLLGHHRGSAQGANLMLCNTWRGVAWRGAAWRGVAWRGVAWRNNNAQPNTTRLPACLPACLPLFRGGCAVLLCNSYVWPVLLSLFVDYFYYLQVCNWSQPRVVVPEQRDQVPARARPCSPVAPRYFEPGAPS